jgi:hypothetical protein
MRTRAHLGVRGARQHPKYSSPLRCAAGAAAIGSTHQHATAATASATTGSAG